MTLDELRAEVSKFRDKRDWAQFHTPKNLAIAIAVEAAELLDLFKWDDGPQSLSDDAWIAMELADVVIYCLNMADVLDIDLASVVMEKLYQNGVKYPVDEYRGKWKV